MRLFKIKNKEMYNELNEKKRNNYHIYAVYKDKKTKEYRAIQLTHMYDPKRQKQLEKGFLKVENIKQLKYPTGVRNSYYTKDINGNKLDFGRKTKYKNLGSLPTSQANRIKKFAKKKLKNKKRKNHKH